MSRRLRLAAAVLLALLASPAHPIDLDEKIQQCAACHGENGVPTAADIPVIWGQQLGYLYLQLRDYKLGVRRHELMDEVVKDLEKADMMKLAEHFSKKPWPKLQIPSASEADAASARRSIVAAGCPACHLDTFLGTEAVPRLADQQTDYLNRTMLWLKTKQRGNSPFMSTLLGTYSDEQIAALAKYISGL